MMFRQIPAGQQACSPSGFRLFFAGVQKFGSRFRRARWTTSQIACALANQTAGEARQCNTLSPTGRGCYRPMPANGPGYPIKGAACGTLSRKRLPAPFDTAAGRQMNPQIQNQKSGAVMPPLLVTEPAMAAACAISARHMRNLRARRLVPFVMLGTAVRYSPAAVRVALEALTVQPRPEGRALR
jgi:hypothetical protein